MKPALSPLGALTLLAVACLTIMVGCVIVPGLPTIARSLGIQNASWLITLPSLGVIVFGPLAGRLIDRVGLYKVLCLGLFTYGLLGATGVMLRGPAAVFADRFLLGGPTAMIMAAGTGLISEFYEGNARLDMIARQGMSIELGGVIFLFVAGLLASVSWQWPFVLYLTAWALLALVLYCVPEPATASVQMAQGESASAASHSLKRVFTSATLSMIIFFTAIIVLPLRLHDLELNEAQVGYFLSFVSLVAVGAALMPMATRKVGEQGTLMFGFVFYALAHLAFVTANDLTLMTEGALCLGLGFGLTVPLLNHMTVEHSHPHQRGRNLARLSVAIFAGQFLSSFMAIMPGAQSHAFLCAAGLAVLAAGLITLSAKRRRNGRHI